MKTTQDLSRPRVSGRLFAIVAALWLVGCATPAPIVSMPDEFSSAGSGSVIQTRDEFVSKLGGKPLRLLHDSVDATLVFDSDGTASGMLTRGSGDTVAMALDWEWEGATYCRTGMIGDAETTRKCESVTLFPDVGILLTYVDADDPEEYWLFE